MTTRSDVDVEFNTSPRIAEVASPSVEITMQDLVDTLRKQEDSFVGMSFDKLINASGKEDLGGGVKVGITVAMQNLLLAFAGRTVPAETGTVTGSPASPVAGRQIIQDTAALFISNNVQRGSLIVNFTDQSIAEVVSVDFETQLTTKTLTEGIGNTYDIDDEYKVWNVVQVSATGGNLVAVNDLQDVIDAILPTAFTQVILTASSSATLQEQADIQYASFGGGVTIDVIGGEAGTVFPAGTPRQPSNNLIDGHTIADDRGFFTFLIKGDITIDASVDADDGHTYEGESKARTKITLLDAAKIADSEYKNATITGVLDGSSSISNCVIETLTFLNGYIDHCILSGTITLGGGVDAHIVDCWSGVPGGSTPTIDMGGTGQGLGLRNYNGGITLTNKTGTEDVSIDMNSGQVIIDDTVTDGDIYLRGVGTWTNRETYTGGANVVNQLIDGVLVQEIEQLSYTGVVHIDTVGGSSGTAFPIGTLSTPVDNMADALLIMASRGIETVHIHSDLTLSSGSYNNLFLGNGIETTTITISGSATVDGARFGDCTLTGSVGGSVVCTDAVLRDLTSFNGQATNCGLQGDIVLSGDVISRFVNCYNHAIVPATRTTIDIGGSGNSAVFHGYQGNLDIDNMSGAADAAVIGLHAGNIRLLSGLTDGNVILFGIGTIESDASSGITLNIDGLVNKEVISETVWDEDLTGHDVADSAGKELTDARINAANAFAVSA